MAEAAAEVGMTLVQDAEEAVDQFGVVLAHFAQAQLGGPQPCHGFAVGGRVAVEDAVGDLHRLFRLFRQQRQRRLQQARTVPVADLRLLVVGVAPGFIGVIADMVRVEGVHEPIGAIVQRQAQGREIVGIHHAVAEAHRLPLRHQARGAFHQLGQPGLVAVVAPGELRIVLGYQVVGQRPQPLVLLLVVEELEVAEADEAGRGAAHHGSGFQRFAPYRRRGADQAQRTGGGNAQGMHRLRGQVFADRGAQHRAAIGEARPRRLAAALELEFPAGAVVAAQFGDEVGAAVAELRHQHAELMSGIDRADRGITGPSLVAAHDGGEIRGRGVHADLLRQRRVEMQQLRFGQGRGGYLRCIGFAQAGEAPGWRQQRGCAGRH